MARGPRRSAGDEPGATAQDARGANGADAPSADRTLVAAGLAVYAVQAIVDVEAVVVGAGVAGLTAALELAAKRDVLVVSKAGLPSGSTAYAQGGVAVAMAPGDSPAAHAADTVRAAAGTADAALVDILTREGPRRVRDLIARGARFDRALDGTLRFGREAAHDRARILHAAGDATGAEIGRALAAAVHRAPRLTVWEHAFACDLVRAEGGGIAGVVVRRPDGALVWVRTPAVVMATGGIGRLYAATTNPAEVTGDGLAMAARAGAALADLEFVQFHPTALAVPGADPLPLISEAVRGEGAILVDAAGQRFMPALHPLAELAPRDVVARAIAERLATGGAVYLDARAAVGAAFPERFPTIFGLCMAHGIDPRIDPIPVTPAAHYHMGGIAVDARGRATVPGLWACGEAACSGLHGANRLASNSLLDGLVFGSRVAEDVEREVGRAQGASRTHGSHKSYMSYRSHEARRTPVAAPPPPGVPPIREVPAPRADAADPFMATVRAAAWRGVGVVRDAAGLREAAAAFDGAAAALGPAPGEAANLALVGQLVAAAALARRESRGAHARRDFPKTSLAWRRRLVVTWDGRRARLGRRALPGARRAVFEVVA